MAFPIPNSSDLVVFLQHSNVITNGWFWTVMLIVFAFVMTMFFLRFGIESALVTSTFLTTVMSIWWGSIGLVTNQVSVISAIALFLSFIYMGSQKT